ncbi:MAG: nuclear transport factor 2 family protein [Acidimicrobiia bacterium]|nr:nuclear transport factor 2 family protein [Acidimicrobiia bacterium]
MDQVDDRRAEGDDLDRLRARVARLEAREEVLDCFREYLYALDGGRVDDLLDVFTEDVTFEAVNFPPGSGETVARAGREALAGLYGRYPASIRRHHAANTSVEVGEGGDTAELSSYYLTTGAYELAGGLYEGTFRRDGGRWRIARWRVTSQWGWRLREERPPYLADPLDRGTMRGGRPAAGC